MCGRVYDPRFLYMWSNARISVMGGEQAAKVLAKVREDALAAKGGAPMTDAEREAFTAPIRAKYEEEGGAKGGVESKVNCTHGEWKKTGSLYDVVNVSQPLSQDNKWWLQEIIVEGRKVTVKVDGKTVLEYTEPVGAQPGKDFERKLGEGTFALQGHDPKSVIHYRNIRVKRLD